MIRIVAHCANIQDGTSLYRGAGPLGALMKKMPNLEVQYPEFFTWVLFKNVDILFLQRPSEPDHVQMLEIAKNCNVPVWVEMDDDLFNVPPQNPAYANYIEPERRARIELIIRQADLVTTASDHLAGKLRAFNKNVIAIENALDETWLKNYNPLLKAKDKDLVFWRGSDSHIKDLMSVYDQIIEVSESHPNVMWRFSGYLPWFLCENLAKAHHVKSMDPMRYFQFLKKSEHHIAMFPLLRDELNLCKSNIAWQENTLAGAAVLAPDFPTWQKPGITNYSSPEDFKDKLTQMLKGEVNNQTLDQLVKSSLDHILDNYTLTKLNEKRKECIEILLSL